MRQWLVEFAVDTVRGPKIQSESYYMPTENDVRNEIVKRGAYVISIRRMNALLLNVGWHGPVGGRCNCCVVFSLDQRQHRRALRFGV